jgi:hypothetical protein
MPRPTPERDEVRQIPLLPAAVLSLLPAAHVHLRDHSHAAAARYQAGEARRLRGAGLTAEEIGRRLGIAQGLVSACSNASRDRACHRVKLLTRPE